MRLSWRWRPGPGRCCCATGSRCRPGRGTIEAYLARQLGREVVLSMHLGAPRANRKPVLQLLTDDGDTIAYAKVGTTALTSELVRAERAALDRVAAAGLSSVTAPAVRHLGTWHGLDVLILDALPVWQPRAELPAGRLDAAMAEVARLARQRQRAAGQAAATPAVSARGWPRRPTAPTGGRSSGSSPTWPGRERARCWNSGPGTATGRRGTWPAPRPGCCCGTGSASPPACRSASTPCTSGCSRRWCRRRPTRPRRPPGASSARRSCCARWAWPRRRPRLTARLYLCELSARYLADRQAEAGARLGAPGRWLIPALAGETEVEPMRDDSRVSVAPPARRAAHCGLGDGRAADQPRPGCCRGS